MATIDEAVQTLKAVLVNHNPRTRPIPLHLLEPLCEAVWSAHGGISPNSVRLLLDVPWRSVNHAVNEWRRRQPDRVLPYRPRRPSAEMCLNELVAVLSPGIQTAPRTCLDPLNDGRWGVPPAKVLRRVFNIENQSIRDTLTLFVLTRAKSPLASVTGPVGYLHPMLRDVMVECSIQNVSSIEPNDLVFQVLERKVGKHLSEGVIAHLYSSWNVVCHAFDQYAAQLSVGERTQVSGFFLRPITEWRKFSKARRGISLADSQSQSRVKAKTDTVHAQFYKIRFAARIRLNQSKRLYDAFQGAIEKVERNQLSLPHEFSYEETMLGESGRKYRQRVHLTLWDGRSVFDRAVSLGYKPDHTTKKRLELKHTEAREYQLEYRCTESVDQHEPQPFWFLELYEHDIFSHSTSPEAVHRKQELNRRFGYKVAAHGGLWPSASGLLSSGGRGFSSLMRKAGHLFLPVSGIYASCLFAHFIVRVITITGARLGEVQQIAQSARCVKKLENVGPKAKTRWVLRMVPKGRLELENYYIDEDTKMDLLAVIRFHQERSGRKELHIVKPNDDKQHKASPDRYVLQWDRGLLDQGPLNTILRFLLHGLLWNSVGQAGVQLSSHLLRHAFATELANLKTSIDVIAQILHQRDTSVTKYYARPTRTQVMEAADLIFVDRVDLAAEAIRGPEEIRQMLKDAEGKVGALTEVLGGTCTVGNMCAAKFACIGCVGNAPDPGKRAQVERKMEWAKQQLRWAAAQSLCAEERQMKQLVQDCGMMLEEMGLIDEARADSSQLVTISLSQAKEKI